MGSQDERVPPPRVDHPLLAQLQSKLQQLSQTSQAPSHQQIVNLFNSSAPQVYKQLVQLANPFKTKAKNLPTAAQQFLTNLQQRSEELKANQNQTKTNFTILHNFFQEIYINFTSLDNASRKAITGFFPTLSHIFGSQQFVNYLKACANATSFAQLSPINQQFNDYVTAHACDKQSSSSNSKK
uniref:Uncharacterized protein n=1 Tax=Acrobeloides nanus TaxID=290746 RepID=A0A914C3B1_9BILA